MGARYARSTWVLTLHFAVHTASVHVTMTKPTGTHKAEMRGPEEFKKRMYSGNT